ncbi:RICIN domain-containing protein [Kitasatospora sp. Ki12]
MQPRPAVFACRRGIPGRHGPDAAPPASSPAAQPLAEASPLSLTAADGTEFGAFRARPEFTTGAGVLVPPDDKGLSRVPPADHRDRSGKPPTGLRRAAEPAAPPARAHPGEAGRRPHRRGPPARFLHLSGCTAQLLRTLGRRTLRRGPGLPATPARIPRRVAPNRTNGGRPMFRRSRLAAATTVLATAVATAVAAPAVALTTPAAPAAADFGPAEIRTGMYAGPNDLCLEVADWRTDNGAPVRIWTCTGGANQKWTQTATGWINQYSGKCLEIPAYSTTWGTQAGQWTCNGGTNQKWSDPPASHPGTPRRIVNANSGLVLDVSGGALADGTPVIQWEYSAGANQFWHYNPEKDPYS